MSSKRNRLQIIHDILEAVRKKEGRIKPTHIMYKANLSHAMLEDYLNELIEKGFIEEVEDGDSKTYKMKQRGFDYLNEYVKIMEFTESFGLSE